MWQRDVWLPHTDHPLRILVEEGVPLVTACGMAGDDDAFYAAAPKAKPCMRVQHPDACHLTADASTQAAGG